MVAGAALGIVFSAVQAVSAQDLPNKPGPERTVKLFNMLCAAQLPNITPITKFAASAKLTELKGAALQSYQASVPADEIRAWQFSDFGGQHTLIVTRKKQNPKTMKVVSGFEKATSYGCTLMTPRRDAKADILTHLIKLTGRKPDSEFDQGPLHAQT